MTEKELIILLKEGDEKAFTTLYRRYWSKVYNFSRLYLSSILEIEEVVQEVFVKVWESRSLLREDDNCGRFTGIYRKNGQRASSAPTGSIQSEPKCSFNL